MLCYNKNWMIMKLKLFEVFLWNKYVNSGIGFDKCFKYTYMLHIFIEKKV